MALRLSHEILDIETAYPFGIARGTVQAYRRVWVRLTDDDGVEGWGEADPSYYYGETADTVVAALAALGTALPADPFDLEAAEARLAKTLKYNPAARSALSAALHDLVGKRLGVPLWKLWGLDPAAAPPSDFTIGLDTLDVIRRKVREAAGDSKYIICNGDEGDPGAFMDRMLLESFPYRVIEGLAIAALAVGAHEGIFYVRAEYPLAVRRIREALVRCRERGILGEAVLGTDFRLELSLKEGAGAFVCGEETALLASIEGRRGMPHLRPPYPAESGLWEKPTLVNNVETYSLVPWIFRHGAEAFAALGTAKSKGTKVFALAGKVQRGGLIEVPMGVTLRQIVEDIGGGVASGRQLKAIQVGGPSGGCVPAELADTPVDYEALTAVGAIMGSGGLVVLDDTDCMVDIARYFLRFTQDQSCGKCTFCRIGTRRMLDVLERICAGHGRQGDLELLERLSKDVSAGSLCGLGKTAPNPVLSTLRYFREEYEAHLQGRCPAGKCKNLIKYKINERCIGCTLCAQHCPADAIPLTPYVRHRIEMDKCTRCDNCRLVCPEKAVFIE